MKRLCILSLSLVLPACSGDDSTPPADNGNNDASVVDSSVPEDTGLPQEDAAKPPPDTGTTPADGGAGATDSGASDSGPTDSGPSADAGESADADAGPGIDASCPASWFETPVVDPSIAIPDGGGGVILHAIGTGTQNYGCFGTLDAGVTTYAWSLVTPEANLTDCHDNLVAHHFASVGGPNFPEWQAPDGGDYVIGTKHVPTFTPDGGSGSVAWLRLNAVDAGGAGTLSMAQYIQRLNTDGGIAPPNSTCDVAAAADGGTVNVPYSADYYFYGP